MAPEYIISLENVDVFQQKHLVLAQVNLHIKRGEFVYLIGHTGSGKSSLLKTIYGDLHIHQGEGQVCGFNLKTMKLGEIPFLRRKLGIVFQDFQLFSDRDIEENLLFVLRATGWKEKPLMEVRMREVLELVGLRSKARKMPHELSGGEQQRMVIARALLNHPEIILADEPTGNLDPERSMEIMSTLLNISKLGTSVLMATHNYGIINRFPSRVVRCESGKVLENDAQFRGVT